MRPGLPVSALLHGALIAWILFGFPHAAPIEEAAPVDAMPVEFVPIESQSAIRQGQKTAKPKDEVSPTDTAKAAKESQGTRAGTDAREDHDDATDQQVQYDDVLDTVAVYRSTTKSLPSVEDMSTWWNWDNGDRGYKTDLSILNEDEFLSLFVFNDGGN